MQVHEVKSILAQALRGGDEQTAAAMRLELVQQLLEVPNWAPWKAFSTQMFCVMQSVCPEGQLSIFSDDMLTPHAALSMQRIRWNGDPTHVPSWSYMIKNPYNFQTAYEHEGNSLVMLNINVSSDVKGANLPARLIELAIASAQSKGITHIIGLFRPNQYGAHKRRMFDDTGRRFDDIEAYSRSRRDDGQLHDSWLRNLERNGMRPLGISHNTYSTTVSIAQFRKYRAAYNPSAWIEVSPNVWECGECGSWVADKRRGTATYSESRVIGIVWKS